MVKEVETNAGRQGWDGRVKDHRERRVEIVGIGTEGSESESDGSSCTSCRLDMGSMFGRCYCAKIFRRLWRT